MEFGFTAAQERFREEIRNFFEAELKAGTYKRSIVSYQTSDQSFSKKFAARGWIGFSWPREYGGQGRSWVDRSILVEESYKHQAPTRFHILGDKQVGPALIHFGSPELKEEFLPKIREAEISFCLLFSEPDAGSDLVSLRTTAREEGDFYVVNGQKVWTTAAHDAMYGWLLARTDLEAPKHKGVSEFILDMKSPGVTVRPLINMVGVHSFNEVFLEDVKVPKRNLVGVKNAGFRQILEQLDFERAGFERLLMNYRILEDLLRYVKETKRNGQPLSKDPLIRDELAQLEIDYQAGWLLCYRVAWILDQGRIPNYEAAQCKSFCTQFEQRLSEAALRIMGLPGQLMAGSKYALFDGDVAEACLWSPSWTVAGGSVEVLKNIVAMRGLGMQVKQVK